jgi:hypothetical protein
MPIQLTDIKGVIESNPQVDLAKVKEALDLWAELQRYGVRPATYELGSPYQRPRPKPGGRRRPKPRMTR